MTCAEWIARVATLQAAELKALTGQTVNIQDGEHRLGKAPIPLNALQSQIVIAQRQVDKCNGCRPRHGRAIVTIPVDY